MSARKGLSEYALDLRDFFGVGIASSIEARRGWNKTLEVAVSVSFETIFFFGVFDGVGSIPVASMLAG